MNFLNNRLAKISFISIALFSIFHKVYKYTFNKLKIKKYYDSYVIVNDQIIEVKSFLDTGNEVNCDGIPVCFTNNIQFLKTYYKKLNIQGATSDGIVDLYRVDKFYIKIEEQYECFDIYLAYLDSPHEIIVGIDCFIGGK